MIQRWDCDAEGNTLKCDDGQFVRFEDHALAMSAVSESIEHLLDLMRDCDSSKFTCGIFAHEMMAVKRAIQIHKC